jgi:hypothetical protein
MEALTVCLKSQLSNSLPHLNPLPKGEEEHYNRTIKLRLADLPRRERAVSQQ